MEINTWIDFLIYVTFTLSVLFVGLPIGARLSYYSIKRLFVKGNSPYSRETVAKQFGKTPIETLFVGLFMLVVSIWYLFFDRGGALLTFYTKVASFV
ncbi:hypothetical protein CWB96_09260 [Pseudoalteromonas citrea]|uniref:Uncharacterized protein n=1 Tax=Pseudoalteromonas citrea TaxID=43655 RepID=A0A5S3XS60_9GAMM|nr:hypothetical protein CWB97_20405 [Pseudoalteromonas citrea]TMP59508.1 hypothetical protein CWB96_09260 [Pseudoalteromonas citrea]